MYTQALRRRARDRLTLIEALRRALPAGELRLHYQPLVDLGTGAVVGLEALTRWQPPNGPLRAASEFIDVVEDTDLIVEVDRWALQAAGEQAAVWARAGHPVPRLAVNVSARRLADPQLLTDVETVLTAGPVRPTLWLEITERAVVERPTRVSAALHRLRELGVTVALDDFGTGQSALAYLQQFPVDVVKLDRSFLTPHRRGDDRLIRGLLALARTLDLTVVVEGIETPAQLARLRALPTVTAGPLIGQGYLLGRPAPQPRPPRQVPIPA